MSNMRQLAVEIVRFVNESFPGWVASEFVDANGKHHTIIDKVPTFTNEILDENSRYPRPGDIACEVLAEWEDHAGCKLVRITTPGMDSTEGLTEFVVLPAQLSAAPPST